MADTIIAFVVILVAVYVTTLIALLQSSGSLG